MIWEAVRLIDKEKGGDEERDIGVGRDRYRDNSRWDDITVSHTEPS